MAAKVKAYSYLRVSTEKQVDGYSIDAQRDNVKRLAELKNIEIVQEYVDAGFSGADIVNRPSFTQMMQDIESEKDGISYVLAFKLSRIGRNAIDTLDSLRKMQKHGVNIVSDDGAVDSSSAYGNFMITIMSALAEMERENIKAQTFAGRVRKASEGRWNGGQAPYGYRLKVSPDKADKGVLEINEDEAPLVRIIFDRYVNHEKGFGSVAEYLVTHGYSKITRENGKLEYIDESFVKRVIKNEVYIGLIPYGKRTNVKNEKTGKTSTRIQEDYKTHVGLHEAIISQELWDAAQKKRGTNWQYQPKVYDPNHAHIFSGILVCPVCGSPMHGVGGLGKVKQDGKHGGGQYYYSCSCHRRKKGQYRCSYAKGWRQELIDGLMANIIVNLTQSQGFENEMEARLGESIDVSSYEKDIERISAAIKQKTTARNKLAAQMDSLPYDTPHYDELYEDINRRYISLFEEIDALQNELEDTQKTIQAIKAQTVTRDGIFKFISDFGRVYDQLPEVKKKELAAKFIRRIEIFPEEQEDGSVIKSVTFKFPVSFGGQYLETLDTNSCTTLSHVENVALLIKT